MRNITISNSEDVMDCRHVIARFEELEAERAELKGKARKEWDADNGDEFKAIGAFLEEMKGNGGDEQWRGDWYPVTLVRETYFKDYAQELAEELDLIKVDAPWPNSCIDWEQAARELRMDYTGADFDGVTYYFR